MIRVVIDTNVVLSALLFEKGCQAWIRYGCQSGRFTPVLAQPTTLELLPVLGYSKFGPTPAELKRLFGELRPWSETCNDALARVTAEPSAHYSATRPPSHHSSNTTAPSKRAARERRRESASAPWPAPTQRQSEDPEPVGQHQRISAGNASTAQVDMDIDTYQKGQSTPPSTQERASPLQADWQHRIQAQPAPCNHPPCSPHY
jgi:hypothetical protein